MTKQKWEDLRHMAVGVFTIFFSAAIAIYFALAMGYYLMKLFKFLTPFLH